MTEFENKLASTPITMDCFEMDDFFNMGIMDYEDITHEDCWNNLLQALEELRNKYNKTKDKRYWKELIRLLPNSYKCFNQLEKENEKLKECIKMQENEVQELYESYERRLKPLQKENEELKATISKTETTTEKNSEVEGLKKQIKGMMCCGNCGHYQVPLEPLYCELPPEDCKDKSKWRIRNG